MTPCIIPTPASLILANFIILSMIIWSHLPKWCATRQEDTELLISFVPPVEQSAGGLLMPQHSNSHGIQQESLRRASAGSSPCCNTLSRILLRSPDLPLKYSVFHSTSHASGCPRSPPLDHYRYNELLWTCFVSCDAS